MIERESHGQDSRELMIDISKSESAIAVDIFIKIYNDIKKTDGDSGAEQFFDWLSANDEESANQILNHPVWKDRIFTALKGVNTNKSKIFWLIDALATVVSGETITDEMKADYRSEGEFVPDQPVLSTDQILAARKEAAANILASV